MSRYELANLTLWAIAIVTTMAFAEGVLTYLAPVFFVCVMGSIVIVRKARESAGRP